MTRETRTNTHNPMKERRSGADGDLIFNVAGLMGDPAGTVRDLQISAPPLDLADEIVQTAGITGTVQLMRTNRGLIVRGRLRTAIAQECSRCLRPLDWPVVIEMDEEALPTLDIHSGKPVVLDDAEDEDEPLRLTDHHELDLEGEVRDAISLAEPIAPLCREDCPGLCLVCGLELGSGPHDHPDEDIDPRLEELRKFVD
jgi:uncharacterized protein